MEYYVGGVRVCRGFYQASYGISKRKIDMVSQLVLNKPQLYPLVPLDCPVNRVPRGPTQLQMY